MMFEKLKKMFKGMTLPPQQKLNSNTDETTKCSSLSLNEEKLTITDINKQNLQFKSKKSSQVSEHKLNKKGIRVIDSRMDLSECFYDDDTRSQDETNHEPIQEDIRKEKVSVKKKVTRPTKKTKNGFILLDDREDFSLFPMEEDEKDNEYIEKTFCNEKNHQHDSGLIKGQPRNKHGIPLLPEGHSDYEKNEFVKLLNRSLGQKTRDVLMNEKGVRTRRKNPLTLNEKLKRYPLPQSQLDLHGYTSIKAELRCETYIKNSYGNGQHTVNIIVGKGIHSDEGAVLPDVVENLLIRLKKEGIVLSYGWENEKKSRSGSVTVYLNNVDFSEGNNGVTL